MCQVKAEKRLYDLEKHLYEKTVTNYDSCMSSSSSDPGASLIESLEKTLDEVRESVCIASDRMYLYTQHEKLIEKRLRYFKMMKRTSDKTRAALKEIALRRKRKRAEVRREKRRKERALKEKMIRTLRENKRREKMKKMRREAEKRKREAEREKRLQEERIKQGKIDIFTWKEKTERRKQKIKEREIHRIEDKIIRVILHEMSTGKDVLNGKKWWFKYDDNALFFSGFDVYSQNHVMWHKRLPSGEKSKDGFWFRKVSLQDTFMSRLRTLVTIYMDVTKISYNIKYGKRRSDPVEIHMMNHFLKKMTKLNSHGIKCPLNKIYKISMKALPNLMLMLTKKFLRYFPQHKEMPLDFSLTNEAYSVNHMKVNGILLESRSFSTHVLDIRL